MVWAGAGSTMGAENSALLSFYLSHKAYRSCLLDFDNVATKYKDSKVKNTVKIFIWAVY